MSMQGVEGQGLRFDNTINLGHILTIGAILMGMALAYTTYALTVSDHDSRLRYLETVMKTQQVYNVDTNSALWTIKQDVAVIRDRLERGGVGK